uniref:Uncharacterized protein LOC100378665 n=1 Tax=Saccoglossus kowalevskii TaxID=10224 RepID=A0ABM0GPL9_SACKO|nr:PREDICTED: uncharacterized protein LOC100378665 [Saccoglossus kowalevskii]
MVIHFYLSHTARLLKKERLIRRVLEPFLLMNFVYFTVVTIMAIVLTKNSWIECLQPYWLMLSTVEFVVVQVFFVAGIVITRKLNEVRQLDSARNAQKRDLWGLIIVFEVSAFVTLVYDITVSILGTEERGCSDIFNNMQSVYTAVYAFVNIFKIMLPMWAMLCVFHAPSKQENGPNNFSINSDNRSVFQPRSPRHYNRLSYPDLRTAACPQYVNTPRRSQSYATMPSIEEEDTNYLIT